MFFVIIQLNFASIGLSSKTCRLNNSFTENTLVHTNQGLTPIQEIEIGDTVWTYNENTNQGQWNEVVYLIQGEQEYDLILLTLESGEIIEATDEHPFYLQNHSWNTANRLKIGDILHLQNDMTAVIKEIDTAMRFEKVYNLAIANTHNYFITKEGVLVHNAKRKKKCLSIDFQKNKFTNLVQNVFLISIIESITNFNKQKEGKRHGHDTH